MKLRLIWIGKTRSAPLAQLVEDYLVRLRRFVPVEVTEIRDPRAGDERRQLELEQQRVLSVLDSDDRVVVLDVAGQAWSSPQAAAFVGKHLRGDPRRLTFVIGGYGGIGEKLRSRAERKWSLSPLTFTHEMTRFVLIEQLYRALCILNNHPYSK